MAGDVIGIIEGTSLSSFMSQVGKSVEKRNEYRNKATQWSSGDGKLFFPTATTAKELDPGLYDAGISPQGDIRFMKLDVKDEELISIPDSVVSNVVEEVKNFWGRREIFKKAGLTHKRGIMLYGEQGAGKSCSIRLLLKDVINQGGIGLNFTGPEEYLACMRVFRLIQPETPVVVIMEDLDAMAQNLQGVSRLLNLLDGVEGIDHVVYLATTNFVERLDKRFINRPSRFDKLYYFGYPSPAARKAYLEHVSKGFEIDIEKYVADTSKLSFAHLKELFIATAIMDVPYKEALDRIRDMIKLVNTTTEDITKRQTGLGIMGFMGATEED